MTNIYKNMGNAHWREEAKKRGLSVKDYLIEHHGESPGNAIRLGRKIDPESYNKFHAQVHGVTPAQTLERRRGNITAFSFKGL